MKKFPSEIAVLWIVAAIGTATLASAASPKRVDGVPVYGDVHAVTVADIRKAIKNTSKEPAAEVEVISSKEMHVYFRSRELGWSPVRAKYVGSELRWVQGGLGISDTAEALHFIRDARGAYIFPVRFTEIPGHNGY